MKKLLISALVATAVLAISSVGFAQTASVWADYWMSTTVITGDPVPPGDDVTVTGYSTIVGGEATILPKVVIGGEYVTRPTGVINFNGVPVEGLTEGNSLMGVWLGYKLLEDESISFYPVIGYVSGSLNVSNAEPYAVGTVSGFVVGAGASLNLGNALSASGRFLYAYSLAGDITVGADSGLAAGSGYVGEARVSYAVLPQVTIDGGYRVSSWSVYPIEEPDFTVALNTSGLFVGVSARF